MSLLQCEMLRVAGFFCKYNPVSLSYILLCNNVFLYYLRKKRVKYLTCPPLLFWQWPIHRWDWACRTFSPTRSPRTGCWWRAGCASLAAIQTCRLWNRTMSWTWSRKCWSRLGGQLFCNWLTGRGLPYGKGRWLSDLKVLSSEMDAAEIRLIR